MHKRYDVLTIGETMIRLSPPRWQRLEQADYFEIVVGGTESNAAVCLSRLGLRVAWVSRLVQNPLGRRIVQTLRAQGVDVSHVVWVPRGRIGVYFVEFGPPPRPTNVVYDRRGSAMSEMTLSDLDPDLLDKSRLVHLTGITPALSPQCHDLIRGILSLATERGVLRSFDVNYRAKLWSPDEARATLEPLCADLDVLFITQQDALRLFDCRDTPEATLHWIQDRFNVGVAVLTMGEAGAMALDRDGHLYRAQTEPAPEIDPLGSGDAFAAGFLYGYLTDGDLETDLKLGTSAAALKRTIPGDLALITLEEIQASESTVRQIRR